jgi:hypothetical protein
MVQQSHAIFYAASCMKMVSASAPYIEHVSLFTILAIPLSQQAGKWLVIPLTEYHDTQTLKTSTLRLTSAALFSRSCANCSKFFEALEFCSDNCAMLSVF